MKSVKTPWNWWPENLVTEFISTKRRLLTEPLTFVYRRTRSEFLSPRASPGTYSRSTFTGWRGVPSASVMANTVIVVRVYLSVGDTISWLTDHIAVQTTCYVEDSHHTAVVYHTVDLILLSSNRTPEYRRYQLRCASYSCHGEATIVISRDEIDISASEIDTHLPESRYTSKGWWQTVKSVFLITKIYKLFGLYIKRIQLIPPSPTDSMVILSTDTQSE